jgi:hypothetical protein
VQKVKFVLLRNESANYYETGQQEDCARTLHAKFHVDSDDLLHDIMDFERLYNAGNRDRRDRECARGVQNRSENPGKPKHETKPSPSSQLQSAKTCFRCKEVGHFANSCPSRP